jgi:hypothetical protein
MLNFGYNNISYLWVPASKFMNLEQVLCKGISMIKLERLVVEELEGWLLQRLKGAGVLKG